ncbi:MAG: hypothetical protein IJB86_02795 [Clostridia bacterium]|nr:hypothetical protein [Clostridia bacterium]
MKKRVLCFLFSLVLVFDIIFVANASESDIEVYTLMSGVSDGNGNIYDDYVVDSDGNRVELFEDNDVIVSMAEDTLPVSYSSVDKGIITPAKNQGGSSSCWAFSTISALETSSIMQGFDTLETADYSEAHLTWFTQNGLSQDLTDGTYGDGQVSDHPYLVGGNWMYATSTIGRGAGLQLEENAPWVLSWDESELNTMSYDEDERYISYLGLKESHELVDTSKESVKRAIMKYGSLSAAYYSDTAYYSKNYKDYHQTAKSDVTNHAITVVGWDDNYSKKNFNTVCVPNADGAWLCKNSWGNIGEDGCFWISYEETSLGSFVYFVADKTDKQMHIYQYDGARPYYIFNSRIPASVANTFTAKRDETLTRVGFFSVNDNIDAVVKIYKGASGYESNPILGAEEITVAETQIKNVEYGYQTVTLNEPVALSKGDVFTVVVTYSTDTGNLVYVATEGKDGLTGSVSYGGNPGESFIRLNGIWYATSNMNGTDYNNVFVKAMTVSNEKVLGDANKDGMLNLKDVVYIDRYLADGYDICVDKMLSDVNDDRKIDLKDSVLITRYLAGGYGITLK